MRITAGDLASVGAAAVLAALAAQAGAPLVPRGGYWASTGAPAAALLVLLVGVSVVFGPLARRLGVAPARLPRLLLAGLVAAATAYIVTLRGPWAVPGRAALVAGGRVLVTLTFYTLLAATLPRLLDFGEATRTRLFPERGVRARPPRRDA
ncbi:MAG: hypothetical protein ACJ79S_13225 [Gemmatimonadaceae bacterium]